MGTSMKKAGSGIGCYDLTNIRNLMAHLGNVHRQLSVIHVAGTNGKGSVCACIARILQEAGICTGVYSSPAVFDRREIIRLNGVQIPEEDFAAVTTEVQAACRQLRQEGAGQPSQFEIETAVAFCYFYRKKCELVVLEAGLGGAKDATNIIDAPVCSVITSISRDHMAYLGNTLQEIAAAKAGIIKPGCPCVTAWQKPEVMEVLRAAAVQAGSELWETQAGLLNGYLYDAAGSSFAVAGLDNEAGGIVHCALTGAWQQGNIACALTVIRLLQQRARLADSPAESEFWKKAGRLSGNVIRSGLSMVYLPGRFQRIHEKPDFYIDGAHNEGAALALKETVQNCFTNRSIVYIIGVLADKEYEKVLRLMLPLACRVFTVTPNNPRALDGRVLAEQAEEVHSAVSYAPTFAQAVRHAAAAAGPEGVVLAFGSFSYLGELRQAVKDVL